MDPNKIAILTELLDSSSDDDDMFYEYLKIKEKKKRQDMEYATDITKYSDKTFKEIYRVTKQVACYLIEKFAQTKLPQRNIYKGWVSYVSAETNILTFLWYAGRKCSMMDAARFFNLTIITVARIIDRVSLFLVDITPDYIFLPTTPEEKKCAARLFQTVSGFPGCIGCIGSTSIPTRAPTGVPLEMELKMEPSNNQHILVHAIVTACNKFARVWFEEKDTLFYFVELTKIEKTLGDVEGEMYHMVGSSEYPLRTWLMTPYSRTNNERHKEQFNSRIDQTLRCVKETFRELKGRFRQLQSLEFQSILISKAFIMACCTLHNMCLKAEETELDFEGEGETVETIRNNGTIHVSRYIETADHDYSEPINEPNETDPTHEPNDKGIPVREGLARILSPNF